MIARAIGWAPAVYRLDVTSAKSAYRLSDDPILGYELKPGYRDPDRPDLNNSYPFVNADGERDVEHALAKPPAVERIIVLGDSVVVGLGLEALDDLIPRRLQALLDPSRFEVFGFGAKGYNTRAEVRLLERKGLRWAPDLVIVVYVTNDSQMGNSFDGRHYEFDRPALVNWLFVHSAVFRRLGLQWDLFHFRLELDPVPGESRHYEAVKASTEDPLHTLAQLARDHGFRTLLVVWPTFTDAGIVDLPVLFAGDGSGEMTVERLARANGIPTARLSDAFARDYARRGAAGGDLPTPKRLYTFDEMHATPTGTQVAAEAIRAVLDVHPELLAARR